MLHARHQSRFPHIQYYPLQGHFLQRYSYHHNNIEFYGGIGIVELLYRTNIIALVGGGDKPKWDHNKVMLWDDSQMKVIGELNFKTAVKAVKLRKDKYIYSILLTSSVRNRIIVVLEKKIYVYNFQTLKLEKKFETTPNPRGLIAMSGSKDTCVLACLAGTKGNINVIHFDKNSHTLAIQAHVSDVNAIALNQDGTLVATASTKGQVIRIFSAETG